MNGLENISKSITNIDSVERQRSFSFVISEWAGLLAVMHYCLFRFFEASTFYFDFSYRYRQITFALVFLIGMIRYFIFMRLKYTCSEASASKKKVIFACIISAVCTFVCLIVARKHSYTFLAYYPFIIFCLCGTDSEKVLKVFALTLSVVLFCTICCALSGSIQNYLYLSPDKGKLRGSYGIAYPTDFASYFVFLFLYLWILFGTDSWKNSVFWFFLSMAMCWFVWKYPHSVTSTLCSLLCGVVILYNAIRRKACDFSSALKKVFDTADKLFLMAFPLLFGLFIILTRLYGKGNPIAIRLNFLLSSRLAYTWNHYVKYGIHAFGVLTPQSGYGHGLIHSDAYEFLDSTYGLLLIRYGWVLTVIITFIWVCIARKTLVAKQYRILLAMAVIAVHSFSEHHFPEVNFNILLAMPLCTFTTVKYDVLNRSNVQGNDAHKMDIRIIRFTGIAVLLMTMMVLPKVLSYLRTIFTIEGWRGAGNHSLVALLVCILLIIVLIVIWFSVSLLCLNIKVNKTVSPLLALENLTVLAGIGALVAFSNETIQNELAASNEQMQLETEAIVTVLENAQEPVYGGEKEELYKKRFDGFSDHVFSDMELGRNAKGTILLESGNEGYQLIRTGARYTEISENTGLFTYDDEVIKALQNIGYKFHGYFSSDQNIDLNKLAPMNGLGVAESGELMLWGEQHSLVHGPYLDQYSGKYTVSFTLQLMDLNPGDEDPEREVCRLRVSSNWGEDVKTEKAVLMKDFLENKTVTAELNYNIPDSRGVEFLVLCKDDIAVWISNISWRRTPDEDVWREYTTEGYVKKERYFTADGKPVQKAPGYYGIAYEYGNGNGLWTKSQYLDEDGEKFTKTSEGYAQIIRKYDDLNHICREEYLDEVGKPCRCIRNYAGYSQIYDSFGNILLTRYFDENGELITTTGGYSVLHWEYDSNNNRVLERYLDEDEQPVITRSGYAELHRLFNDRHQVILESYFGVDGNPIALGKNQSQVAYEYDENGNIISFKYLDADGNAVMLTDGWAELHRVYNDRNWIVEESYYDDSGELILRPAGYAIVEREYDNVGNILKEVYLDTERKPIRNTSGYAEIHRVYNSNKQLIKETYYDENSAPMILSKNQGGLIYEYDSTGNPVRWSYLDAEGNPVLLTDNYSELHRTYNIRKQIVEETYYDTQGKPCDYMNRYSKVLNEYDGDNQLSLTWYWDSEGNEVQYGSGYFHNYLNSLQNEDVIIFISVKDDGTYSLTGTLMNDLKMLGVQTELRGKYRNSYCAVLTPDGSLEELSDTETVILKGKIDETEYALTSGGFQVGNTSSIVLNGIELSPNLRGMNIVVLERKTADLLDIISVDTNAKEMHFQRYDITEMMK